MIKMRDGAGESRVSTIEAAHRLRSKLALEGDGFALRDLIRHHEEAERDRKAEIEQQCKRGSDYIEACRALIAVHAARGLPPPKLVPHPDDMRIDDEIGVIVRGPLNEEDVQCLESVAAYRDAFAMQDALDERSRKRSGGSDERVGLAFFMAMQMNDGLVKRNRLSDGEFASLIMHFRAMTKRTLEKEVYRKWQSLGVPMRRGSVLPLLSLAKLQPCENHASGIAGDGHTKSD